MPKTGKVRCVSGREGKPNWRCGRARERRVARFVTRSFDAALGKAENAMLTHDDPGCASDARRLPAGAARDLWRRGPRDTLPRVYRLTWATRHYDFRRLRWNAKGALLMPSLVAFSARNWVEWRPAGRGSGLVSAWRLRSGLPMVVSIRGFGPVDSGGIGRSHRPDFGGSIGVFRPSMGCFGGVDFGGSAGFARVV